MTKNINTGDGFRGGFGGYFGWLFAQILLAGILLVWFLVGCVPMF